MLTQILILLAGLALVVFGADYLVDGASNIARRAGLSEFVIGLTIVGVRIGGPASGHEVPARLHHFLHEVAHEFGRFQAVCFESEAARIGDREDELRYLDAQIARIKTLLDNEDSIIMRASLEHRLEGLNAEKVKLLNR